ncbi:threonine/serine exporter family protein [Faecalibaculum rodentium]|uniref:threonine/serine exporter family protein n=1 Tax=Faecalibaculum rodentium TaxID=1702221 RepID=UPI0023F0C2BE|nr:threonine/serine exporter family protein [Faecalibaculum rodentium]
MDLQESNRLASVVMRAGLILLESGAEIYRVEDTMNRICLSFPGAAQPEAFVTRTGVMFSFKADERIITRVVRVQHYDTDLSKVDEINSLSRHASGMTLSQMERALDKIDAQKGYPWWVIALAGGFCSVGFGMMDCASLQGLVAAFGIGLIIWLVDGLLQKTFINGLLATLISGFLCTWLPMMVQEYLIPELDVGSAVVAAIALLVPGLAITNGIRHTISGDYLSGLAGTTEAFLVAIAIALGCLTAMMVGA